MPRSLLEKHKKPVGQSAAVKSNLRMIPGGRKAESRDHLKDEDWYFIHSFWNSSLFNRHYLRDDFQRKRTDRLADYESEFEIFLNKLLNLCDSKRHEKFHTWNEDQIIKSWILPVMETLGWWDEVKDEVIPQLTFTVDDGEAKRTYRPDLTFVPSQKLKGTIQEKSPGERLEYARRYVILTLEAKYWDRIRKFEKANSEIGAKDDLSKSTKGDSASSLAPGGQLLSYLKHLRNDDPVRNHFGIASDGKVWRLYHVDHPESQFFEFDLGKLYFEITSEENITRLTSKQHRCIEEAARYFFYIFSKPALYSETGEPTLVDELLKHRKDYVDAAEPNLKNRFLTAMRFACNGFDRAFKEAGVKADLATIRDVAESHIFNILFLKSCEANGIIRHEANTDISITSIIERISYFDSKEGIDDDSNERINLIPKFRDFSYRNNGLELHKKILELTEIVQNGGKLKGGSEICAFKETLFSDAEWSLLKKCHLTNIETVKLLYELGYMEEEGRYRQVPYNIFTPEQLGSIYESFLEFVLSRAESDLEFTKKQWKPISKEISDKLKRRETVGCPIAKKGELFFSPDNTERKATGSYYTPDYIVKYIVENTLGSICKGKTADEILSIKVCDPAMGSGHFLTAALRYLTERFLDKLGGEPQFRYRMPTQAKRDVLESCIFGVDINPRAVRLAKMALWLETAYSGQSLERLDDQLMSGDGLDIKQVLKKFRVSGFDGILMNPPYETTRSQGMTEDYKAFIKDNFSTAEDKFDYFVFFLESTRSYLVENGCFGILCPDTILNKIYSKKIRSFLLTEVHLNTIIELGFSAFKQTVPTMIILGENHRSSSDLIACKKFPDLENPYNFISKRLCLERNDFSIKPWMTIKDIQISDVCSQGSVLLGDICEIYNGIQTGDDKKYVALKKISADWEKVVVGSDVKAWVYSWGGKYVLYKPELLHSNTRKDIFDCDKKIIIRQTADRIVAAYDTYKMFSLASTFVIKPFDQSVSVLPLLCILNSKLYLYLYRLINFEQGRVLPQIKKNHIKDLPIRFNDDLWMKLERTAKQLILGKDTANNEKIINSLIYKLYGLSKEQVEHIEISISDNKASKNVELKSA